MSVWTSIADGVMKFFGGSKGVELVDEAFHTSQERTETDQKDLASARLMQAPSHDSPFDILVDAFARAIRPGVTVWLLGGMSGWWSLPKPHAVDPFWQNIFILVITFWFGGRAIMKDIPKMLAALKALRK